MIKIKVEVSSGLHAGVDWEFTSGEVRVGGNSQCEVFLCDEGVPDFCTNLKILGNRVLLSHLDPQVQNSDDLDSRVGRWVYPGQSYSLSCQGVEFTVSIIDLSGLMLASMANGFRRGMASVADTVQATGLQVVVGVALVLGFLSTSVVLLLGTSANETNASTRVNYVKAGSPVEVDAQLAKRRVAMKAIQGGIERFVASRKVGSFEMTLGEDDIDIVAQMSRVQMLAFEKNLESLTRSYGQYVQIKASVSFTSQQLMADEIDVRSVTFGEQPVVTLRQGDRLFLGSFYKDLRLMNVTQNSVVFAGESSVYELPL